MRKMIPVLGLAVLSLNAYANPSVIELYGSAPAVAQVNAFVYFTPTADSLANHACDFADEELNPNGKDHFSSFDATYQNGSYTLDLPLNQTRDNCHYVIEHIYLSVEGNAVLEPIDLLSPDAAAQEDQENAQEGYPLPAVQSFGTQSIGCDFETSAGLCQIDGEVPVLPYKIDLKAQKIRFDITNT
jgi:hypothetical protein